MSNTSPELAEFRAALREGVHAALRYLNSRTPHRFTGVYRYDGEMLRNMALFDRFEPDQQRGGDIPMADGTLCHYDIQRCEPRTSDIPLLKAAAPFILEALQGQSQPA